MFKGLVTGLVLSLSSAAFATPSAPAYAHAPDHVLRDNDQRGYFQRRPPIIRWQTLSTSKRLSGHQVIRVRGNAAYTKLKLQASGAMFVDKVLITFGNGRTQLVDLDKRLSARDPLVIDLNGMSRKITKVEVYGRGSSRSSFRVLAG